MPTITLNISAAEAAAVRAATKRQADEYLASVLKDVVQGCVNKVRQDTLEAAGVRSLTDLTQADIDALRAARGI